MSARPAIDGWFTTGDAPALLGSRCTTCATTYFPPLPATGRLLPQPGLRTARSSRPSSCPGAGRCGATPTRSTSRRRPTSPRTDPYEPFALAAVELAEGITVLGQVADGYGVGDLRVGAEVELVVETLNADDEGDLLIWRWKPVTELGEEADQ